MGDRFQGDDAVSRGFTLIEMAIVLVVVGLVVASAGRVVGPIRDSQRAEVTGHRLTLVQQAIQVYVIRNGCLPCPADGGVASTVATAGLSASTGGTYVTACSAVACTQTRGVVPWRTVGLSEDDATDGWNNRIRYGVAAGAPCGGAGGLQDTNGMIRCTTSTFPAGGVSLNDNDFAGGPEVTNAAYVLVSSGPDRAMALQARTGTATGDLYGQSGSGTGQALNSSDTNVFANGSLNGSTGTAHFDDIARFMSGPMIIQLCGANACGNPA